MGTREVRGYVHPLYKGSERLFQAVVPTLSIKRVSPTAREAVGGAGEDAKEVVAIMERNGSDFSRTDTIVVPDGARPFSVIW